MSRSIVILGTGGNALDVLDIIDAINARSLTWSVKGFLDDQKPAGSEYLGRPVLGTLADAVMMGNVMFVGAIGSDRSFRQRAAILASTGVSADRFATLVHPGAWVSTRARLGRGVFVGAGSFIGGEASLGDHVVVSAGCQIGHETTIGDCSVLAPGAIISGRVQVAGGCYIGAGACVRQMLGIGEGALIGMGAVVVKNVEAGKTVVGNPGRER